MAQARTTRPQNTSRQETSRQETSGQDTSRDDVIRSNPKKAAVDDTGGANGETAAASNRIKDPQDWVTGDEPMTGAQASYLKTLSEQAHDPEAFDPDLHKAEASQRIDELKDKTGR